jgi:hypothetical protein
VSSNVIRIKVPEVVSDIRAGMAYADIREKYGLSIKGLQRLFAKLVEIEAISVEELFDRESMRGDALARDNIRKAARDYLEFFLPVCEKEPSDCEGFISDISEGGIRVIGIESQKHDVKTFSIPVGEFFQMDPLTFTARCRWVRREGPDAQCVAGYEITNISRSDSEQLERLMGMLTAGA